MGRRVGEGSTDVISGSDVCGVMVMNSEFRLGYSCLFINNAASTDIPTHVSRVLPSCGPRPTNLLAHMNQNLSNNHNFRVVTMRSEGTEQPYNPTPSRRDIQTSSVNSLHLSAKVISLLRLSAMSGEATTALHKQGWQGIHCGCKAIATN